MYRCHRLSDDEPCFEIVEVAAVEPARFDNLVRELDGDRLFEHLPPLRPSPILPEPTPAAPIVVAPDSHGPDVLRVLRCEPRGSSAGALRLRVMFSHPMVSVAAVGTAMSAEACPAELHPVVRGAWFWEDLSTLVFEPADGRLPGATRFTVTVTRRARAICGVRLRESFRGKFWTRPPHLVHAHPAEDDDRLVDPVFVAVFDQAVAAEAILPFIHIQVEGRMISARPARADDMERDPLASRFLAEAPQNQAVTFVCASPPPSNARGSVRFVSGLPSVEGPEVTGRSQEFRFRTTAPFTISTKKLDSRSHLWWRLDFSHALAPDVDISHVHVDPPLDHLEVLPCQSTLWIRGRARAATSYRVTLGTGVLDVNGRPLDGPRTVQIDVAPLARSVTWERHTPALVQRGHPLVPVSVANVGDLHVETSRVEPAAWRALLDARSKFSNPATFLLGTHLRLERVATGCPQDEAVLTTVDLSYEAAAGENQMLVALRPVGGDRRSVEWVQMSDLAVTTFNDDDTILVWVSSLNDGSPVHDANVRIFARSNGAGLELPRRGPNWRGGLIAFRLPRRRDEMSLTAIASRAGDSIVHHFDHWRLRKATGLTVTVWPVRYNWRLRETIRVVGWVRHRHPSGDVSVPGIGTVSWELKYDMGVPFSHQGEAQVDERGFFHLGVRLPVDAPTGRAWFIVRTSEGEGRAAVYVSEASRPEMTVSLESVEAGAGRVRFQACASWLAEGSVEGARVEWSAVGQKDAAALGAIEGHEFGPLRFGRSVLQGFTDASGRHSIEVRLPDGLGVPVLVSVAADVTDPQGGQCMASLAVPVHSSDRCVGLGLLSGLPTYGRARLAPGPHPVSVRVFNTKGDEVPDWPVRLQVIERRGRRDQAVLSEIETRSGGSTTITIPESGHGVVEACTHDTRGVEQVTRAVYEVCAQEAGRSSMRRALLRPDRPVCDPGEAVCVYVQAPFAPAHGFLWIEEDGLASLQPLELPEGHATVRLHVEWRHAPRMRVSAHLTGSESGQAVYAQATASVDVSMAALELQVDVQTESTSAPGTTHPVRVNVRDRRGNPVPDAQITLCVQNVAALVKGDRPPQLLQAIFRPRAGDVRVRDVRQNLVVQPHAPRTKSDPTDSEPRCAPPAPPAPELREVFKATAALEVGLLTDEYGQVEVRVPMPDDLTEWRVTVVATAGAARFGSGEADFRTRQPLALRPILPRFVTEGDRVSLGVAVHCAAGSTVDIALRASGIDVQGLSGRQVEVAGGAPPVVRYEGAAGPVESADVEMVGTDGVSADAVRITVPGRSLVAVECRGTGGTVGDNEVHVPLQGSERIEVRVGTQQLVASGREALQRYPFHCAEQAASRLLVLGPSKEADACIQHLLRLQRHDGGTDLWERGGGGIDLPFVSVHAAHALHDARDRQMPVEPYLLSRAADYLRAIETPLRAVKSSRERYLARAYAAWVRHRFHLGDGQPPPTLVLGLPADALLWWVAAHPTKVLRQELDRRLHHDAGRIGVRDGIESDDHFGSPARTMALLLDVLRETDASTWLVDRAADTLCRMQSDGQWGTTQANAFAVRALQRYAGKDCEAGSALVVRIGERETVVEREAVVEVRPGDAELTLRSADGRRVHWQVLQRSFSRETGRPLDRGFSIARRYLCMDDPKEVTSIGPARWQVRRGALVRVEIVVAHATSRHQVALIDPLPAGLEFEASPCNRNWLWRHVVPRMQRVEAFAEVLPTGTQVFRYTCRARHVGEFLAPSTRVEEMYDPQVWGRGRHDRMVVV